MQIHELPTFTGTPGASDYFAVDDGSITSKVAGSDMVNPDAMTVAEATTGTSTAERVVTPKVVHDYVTEDTTHITSATKSSWASATGNDGSIDDIADWLCLSSATIAKWDAILGL